MRANFGAILHRHHRVIVLRKGSRSEVNRRLSWEENASKEDFNLAPDGSNGFNTSDKGFKLSFVDSPFCTVPLDVRLVRLNKFTTLILIILIYPFTSGGVPLQQGDELPKQFSPTDPDDKARKALGVPEQLADAVPSSIAQKIMSLVPTFLIATLF